MTSSRNVRSQTPEKIKVFVDHEALDTAAAEMFETVHFDAVPEQGPDGLAIIAPEPDDPDDKS